MNQPPFRASETRIQAANVARCQGQYALRKQVSCKFRDEEIGPLEVLDRIPHHGDAEFARRVEREIIPLQRRDVENLARVSRPVGGNIDPARRADQPADFIEKESVGAADLEQVALGQVRNDLAQGLDPITKIEPEAFALWKAVKVSFPEKITAP